MLRQQFLLLRKTKTFSLFAQSRNWDGLRVCLACRATHLFFTLSLNETEMIESGPMKGGRGGRLLNSPQFRLPTFSPSEPQIHFSSLSGVNFRAEMSDAKEREKKVDITKHERNIFEENTLSPLINFHERVFSPVFPLGKNHACMRRRRMLCNALQRDPSVKNVDFCVHKG